MLIISFACLLKVVLTNTIIHTSNGPLQGVPSLVEDVDAYLGVPFAEPPIGGLRFAKPVPKKNWTDVYNASTLPPVCTQIDVYSGYYFMPDLTNMSEDCLYLNIWTPKSKPTDGFRPIVFYIHPGAYLIGSSNLKAHDGSRLAGRGDVVVVTINYRLGALGFYSANIEEAEGNMGIHDQIMALNWVKENAKHFYGDPENIVLMGASAGGYTISAFMLSPLVQNLFNRAIIISGSVVHPFMMDDNVRLSRISQSFASITGCSNHTVTLESDPQTVVKCLKSKSITDLMEALKILSMTNIGFLPRMKSDFLPKNSVDLIHEGKFRKDVDVLIGVAENEGAGLLLLGLADYFGPDGKTVKSMTKNRAYTFSRGAVLFIGESDPSSIINYYMSSVKNRTSTGYLKMLSNVIGDYATSCNTKFFADLVSLKGNNVYFYKFGFRSSSTPAAEWVGTTHIDDVQYIFGVSYHGNFTPEETELSNHIIDRWSAFAKTGNPNVPGHLPWLRYTYRSPVYMDVGQEEESIRLDPNHRCEILRKRFRADIDPELERFLGDSESSAANVKVEK